MSGYTSDVTDEEGNMVILKNVGDRVTLWFNLTQDIDSLWGKGNMKIANDVDGYDGSIGKDKGKTKRGMLIVKYTDYKNVESTPIVYSNFLEANARKDANTKIELFEEGDYEVILDYQVVNTSGFDKYTDYKVCFKFSVRNGNCMVYPFDLKTGSELYNEAITPDGFKLDLAKSRYLTIKMTKTVLVDNGNRKIEDVRYNETVNEGYEYTDEGIYYFEVSNKYTGAVTTKKIYVGTDKYLLAMSATGKTLSEIEDLLEQGYTIGEDGAFIEPSNNAKDELAEEQQTENDQLKESEVSVQQQVEETQEEKVAELDLKYFIAIGVVVIIALALSVVIKLKRKS